MTRSSPARRRARALVRRAFAFGLLVGTTASTAAGQGFPGARFTVRDAATGRPMPNVDLCLTVNGQRMQRMTDATGHYNATLQPGPNRAVFARSDYVTRAVDFTVPSSGTVEVSVTLLPGTSFGLPSDCSIPATATYTQQGCLNVTSIAIVGGDVTKDRAIQLRLQFTRPPEFIRVAEFTGNEMFNGVAGFERVNPPWERYHGGDVPFTLLQPHFGTHVVHVQAKLNAFGCLSDPRMKYVTLEPRQILTYTLHGAALDQFVQSARDKGYTFTHSITATKAVCGSGDVAQVATYGDRTSETPLEIIEATYDVLDGPGLAPYWKLKEVHANHPSLPWILKTSYPNRPNVEFDPTRTGTIFPGYSTPTTSRRLIRWRRLTYPSHGAFDGILCVARGGDPRLSRVVLEGPAGEDPRSALRSR